MYETKIRVVPSRIGSIPQQKHSKNSVFTTPKSTTKNVTLTNTPMTNEQNDECSIVITDVGDIVSPVSTNGMTLSLHDSPNVLESVPVTDFVTTPMRLVAIKPPDENLNRDTIDDSVILQFDPGDAKEEFSGNRSDM